MKKFLFILALVFPLIVSGKSPKSILKELDVISLLPEQSDGNPITFWNAIIDGKSDLKETLKKIIEKKGGSPEKTRNEYSRLRSLSITLLKGSSELVPSIDSLKYLLLGDYSLSKQSTIRIIEDPEVNACAAADLDIYVHTGLIEALPSDKAFEYILAVLAHECTHNALSHLIINLYKKYRKESREKFGVGLAAALGTAADAYNHSRYGKETHTVKKEDIARMNEIAERNAFEHSLKCSREQELEADIVAFRLLDWIGVKGEVFIGMLENVIGFYSGGGENSDHPSTYERVELLKYMCTQKRIIYEQ